MRALYEHIAVSEDYPFLFNRFDQPKLDYPLHYHTAEHELTLTLGCHGTRIVGDHLANFGQQDLVMVGAGLPHAWYAHQTLPGAVVMVVQFHQSLLDGLAERAFAQDLHKLVKDAGSGLLFEQEDINRVLPQFERLTNERSLDNYALLIQLLGALAQRCRPIVLASDTYRFRGNPQEHEQFERVHHFLLQHFERPLRLQEAADLLHLSSSAFSHYFHRRTGKSFSRFLTELRVSKACQLLRDSRLSVAQIALECGFQNLSNFNRLFKKTKGCSPMGYKKTQEI
ncbi:MAG: AraC family transcriptional regulator [Cytophagales bacterium]|nr:AraC family transcriptional regulator [Cytophagales bacterium]